MQFSHWSWSFFLYLCFGILISVFCYICSNEQCPPPPLFRWGSPTRNILQLFVNGCFMQPGRAPSVLKCWFLCPSLFLQLCFQSLKNSLLNFCDTLFDLEPCPVEIKHTLFPVGLALRLTTLYRLVYMALSLFPLKVTTRLTLSAWNMVWALTVVL